MNKYEEKKQARIDRLKALSEKKMNESNQCANSPYIKAVIDMQGEPIKIGHHSEGRHRNIIKRADNAMRKSFELEKYSEELKERAISAENNTSVATEDPAAIIKLKIRLKKDEERRETIKAENIKLKKEGKPIYDAFLLQNLGASIRNTKKRIAMLDRRKNLVSKEYELFGVTIKENIEDNRVQLFFKGKPAEDVRKKLKYHGFRWSSFIKCWQRFYNSYSVDLAKNIITEINEKN